MLGLDLFCLDTLPPSSFLTRLSCINALGAICWRNTAERSPLREQPCGHGSSEIMFFPKQMLC